MPETDGGTKEESFPKTRMEKEDFNDEALIEEASFQGNPRSTLNNVKVVTVTTQNVLLENCEVDKGQHKKKKVSTRYEPGLERCLPLSNKDWSELLKGPILLGPSYSFLSFDEACLRSKYVRTKPRKCKELVDFGDKAKMSQTYFSCLNPKFHPKILLNSFKKIKRIGEEEENYSGGSVLCCESMTDSDVIQCNASFHEESNKVKIL